MQDNKMESFQRIHPVLHISQAQLQWFGLSALNARSDDYRASSPYQPAELHENRKHSKTKLMVNE